jgi:hypothetical protein
MLKNNLFTLVFCGISAILQAQNASNFDKIAAPPNGLSAFNRYFNSRLNKPRPFKLSALKGDIEGVVQFTVDTFGRATDIQILDKISPEVDDRVLQILRGMPKWNPAKKNGISVPMPYTYPYALTLGSRNGEIRISLEIADTIPYKWGANLAILGGVGFQNQDLGRLLTSNFAILDMDYELDYNRFLFGLGLDGFFMKNRAPILLEGRLFSGGEDVMAGSFDLTFGYHWLEKKRFRVTPFVAAQFNFLSIQPDLGLPDNPSYEATANSIQFGVQADWMIFRKATFQSGYTTLTRFGIRTKLSVRPIVYKEKSDKNARMSATIVQFTAGFLISGKFKKTVLGL